MASVLHHQAADTTIAADTIYQLEPGVEYTFNYASSGSATGAWQYWNGQGWVDFPSPGPANFTARMNADGRVHFNFTAGTGTVVGGFTRAK